MSGHERLSKELRNRADQLSGHPISFDDVKRSARKMRRQQLAVSGGIAAVVLAIAVPVGLAMVDDDAGTTPGFANRTPTPTVATPSPTKSAAPSGPKVVQLTAEIEGMGGEPQVPYARGTDIILPTGDLVKTPVPFDQFTRLGDGWVGQAFDEATSYLYFLDGTGRELRKVETAGTPLATNSDNSLVAYTDKADKLYVAWGADEASSRELPSENAVDIAGVTGTAPCADPETSAEPTCSVLYNSQTDTGDQKAMISSPHGFTDRLPGRLLSVEGHTEGLTSGVISVADDGSCSAVVDAEGTQLWKTCDYTLGEFSPDGRYVMGHPAYLDGIGNASVSVLDAKTGARLVDYETVDSAFLNNTVWVDEEHLVTLIYDKGWAVLGLDAEGNVTKQSSGRIPGSMEETPLFFPVG